MVSVRQINISGFRGIRAAVSLPLDPSMSFLLYGDNGSGKSSITDALEWFYYDAVNHLSSEEIGRKGVPALRNVFLSDEEKAVVDIQFSYAALSSTKVLSVDRGKLATSQSNVSEDFARYLDASLKENLILRYGDLLEFLLYTKAARLEKVSRIIGFEEVSRTKGVLKKAVNDLRRDLKNRNVDGQVNAKQAVIIEHIGRNINTDEHYLTAIGDLVAPLGLPLKIADDGGVESVLDLIKKPEDKDAVSLQVSYDRTIASLREANYALNEIRSLYKGFYEKAGKLVGDSEKIGKISLERLLSEGLSLLAKGLGRNDECPLCLQQKNRNDLIGELRGRIRELAEFKKEKEALEANVASLSFLVNNLVSRTAGVERETCLSIEGNACLKGEITRIAGVLRGVADDLKTLSIAGGGKIRPPEDFLSNAFTFDPFLAALSDKKKAAVAVRNDDRRFATYSKIMLVRQAYRDIKALKKESEVLNVQLISLEVLYSEFAKRQRDGLATFLDAISGNVNEYFLYMNPGEEVHGIKLVPLGDDDEFVGLTLQFTFHGSVVSPPDKYLSESHVNCIGICLFLASVRAFNQVNGFFVLDDVISSFDNNHRIKFAQLLREKFSDYQILLFTHDKDWFNYIANLVKGGRWLTRRIIWEKETGSTIDVPLLDLKERIEQKFKTSDTSELGNATRTYLEHLLKEIALHMEVRVAFRYNDRNEDRMAHELLSELKGTLKKRKCEIRDDPLLDRLLGSFFIVNKASHDSSFSEGLADLKAFYDDVLKMESLFCCPKCQKFVSKRYYDSVAKQVRCACGDGIKYSWQD